MTRRCRVAPVRGLVTQFQGAGLTLGAADRRAAWLGGLVVAVVVLVNVVTGGMRSITFVQAFQYWLKLTALLVPAVVPAARSGSATAPPTRPMPAGAGRRSGSTAASARRHPLYTTYSLIVATFLGTMGLPHVVVRFYTNPDGRAARRTTLVVLGLLGLFYLCRRCTAPSAGSTRPSWSRPAAPTRWCWSCRALMVGGVGGELLAALVTAGAFAAFLSTGVGPDHRGGRRAQPGRDRAGGSGASAPSGWRPSSRSSCRCVLALLPPGRRRRPHGRPGLRGGRVDVLPAAGARHLVARAHRRRRGGRAAGRRRRLGRGRGATLLGHRAAAGSAPLLGQPAAWTVPAGLRYDGRRLAG